MPAVNDRDYLYSDKFDGDEVIADLWMGGYPLEGEVPPDWAMVSVGWISSSRHHPGPRIEFQMDDREGAVPTRGQLSILAAFINAHHEEGTPVFVHCTAGINRSGLVLGHFLCSRRGFTGEQAIALIRSKRKSHGTPMQPLCNRSFAEALRQWFPGGA